MKAKTRKTLFIIDTVFALAGALIGILFINGVSFPVPVLVITTIALISGIVDGTALIIYLIKADKAQKLADGYYEEDEEDEE